MSFISYSPNELVYIKGIGYATLLHCGSNSTVTQSVRSPPHKKQSIYFDPDLFNSDHDSNHSKKSKSDEEKLQSKQLQTITEAKVQESTSSLPKPQTAQQNKAKDPVNIIKAKLSDNRTLIFTPDTHLSKTVFLVVKPFLAKHRQQIIVEIQISKTIDTLKKQIFQQLDQPIGSYYNIKLFAALSTPTELNVPSKTISQYFIKDSAKIVLTADYAFGIVPISAQPNSKQKITINNFTIALTKVVEQLKKVESNVAIALPPPQSPLITEVKQQTQQKKVQSPKKQASEVQQQKAVTAYHVQFNTEFSSGKRYWELKIEKMPADEDDLVVGVSLHSNSKTYQYLWGYQLATGKKVHIQKDSVGVVEEDYEPYGYFLKQNDICGVELSFKATTASIIFYKNGISCGKAFFIDFQALKIDNRQLIPYINIGGECQVTLDSKAALPLTSYRLK